MRPILQPVSLLIVAAVLVTTVITGRSTPGAPGGPPPTLGEGQWLHLSDIPWQRADTGSLMMGNEGLPAVDGTFYTGLPIELAGRAYSKGFGVYTPSEIVHTLDGGFSALRAIIGVTDDGLPGEAGAHFLVFLDGVRVYESPPMGPASTPIHVDLPLEGASELRLVTQRAAGSVRGARGAWADVRVRTAPEGAEGVPGGFVQRARARAGELGLQRVAARRALQQQAQRWIETARGRLGGRLPAPGEAPVWAFDQAEGVITIAGPHLAVELGHGGRAHGRLTVVDPVAGRFAGGGWSATFETGGGRQLRLDRDTGPAPAAGPAAAVVDDPVLGPGLRLQAPLRSPGGAPTAIALTVWRDAPVLFVDFDGAEAAPGVARVDFIGGGPEGWVNAGPGAQYVADLTRLRHVRVADDGLPRRDAVAWGKPVYLWSEEEGHGLLLALLGDTPLPPEFALQIEPGAITASASFGARWPESRPAGASPWPTLYVESVRGSAMQDGFGRYRALMAHRYPPPPLPGWFGHQWLSWYVYYMEINEDVLAQEIDFIAQHLGDLGPWHIIVDAGWYIAEGRDGADWRQIDREKFPRGLRWLVDYAHAQGVRVVLYFNAPGVNSRRAEGDWMGLRSLVEANPDWLVPLRDAADNEDYLYNFHHPGFREYLESVLDDYLLEYGVDGIKLDGLGNAWDSVFYTEEGGAYNLSDRSLAATLDAYRLVFEGARSRRPDVYLESGWIGPLTANPYAHTFRYGDEEPVFTRPYPLPGLVEHIDYTAYQQGLLGQRSNIGAVYGDPAESVVNRWWLGAALALGAQVSLSLWHGAWTPDRLSEYRAFLAPYRPFEGETVVGDLPEQRVFSTAMDEVVHIGVLNRALGPRDVAVGPRQLQHLAGSSYATFDVETGTLARRTGPFDQTLPAESFRLLVARASPGLLWGNCRTAGVAAAPGALAYRVTAPPTVEGRLWLVTPVPRRVLWDGKPLPDANGAGPGEPRFAFEVATGLLTVWFPAGGDHDLQVEF